MERAGRCAALAAATLALATAGWAPERFAGDKAEITRLRAASDRAMTAHEVEGYTQIFAEDAVFVWSDGSSAAGRAAAAKRFTEHFADPTFVTFLHTPSRVTVAETGERAVEHGVWRTYRRDGRGETRYGGDYAAHWAKAGGAWRVRGELYVRLYCEGPACGG